MISDEIIEQVKKKLVRFYDPVKIYIFGSYAWGRPHDKSDLDLLIVIEAYQYDYHTAVAEGHKILSSFSFAKDILLVTEQEFKLYANDTKKLYGKIKKKGKQIYQRSQSVN